MVAFSSSRRHGVGGKFMAKTLTVALLLIFNNSASAQHCGCAKCTEAIWNKFAVDATGNHTCGERVEWAKTNYFLNEKDACRVVAGQEFDSGVCGPYCDPDLCEPAVTRCGCTSCTSTKDALGKYVTDGTGTHTCGARIDWIITTKNWNELEACRQVAGRKFANDCGVVCDPDSCEAPSSSPTPAPTPSPKPPTGKHHCGCPSCTQAIWNKPVISPAFGGPHTCGERIEFLMQDRNIGEAEACRIVSIAEFPDGECGPFCDPNTCVKEEPPHCGCYDCTDKVWSTLAVDFNGAHTCGERIKWSMEELGIDELQACERVAANEFPSFCGPACNPARCDGRKPKLTPKSALYCFPDYEFRTRFENVWGDFILEAKESTGGETCGPSNNKFVPGSVNVRQDKLTLQYKYSPGVGWHGGEVRVVYPEEKMPFGYGRYKFSVDHIVHKNTKTGTILGDVLPPSLILGMFTWDSTDNFYNRENFNHEVDIEVSRWNKPDGEDVLFLVQPVEAPQTYRFRSGKDASSLKQSGSWYEFSWNPGEISWFTPLGGGHHHAYTTKQANQLGVPDRVQCLPANMEIRINLWNLMGVNTPLEMTADETVEVVINNFEFIPSGRTHVKDGGHCSKNCQCSDASECSEAGFCRKKAARS